VPGDIPRKLQDVSALLAAYAQLFSMQNIHKLAACLDKRSQEFNNQACDSLDQSAFRSDLISFDNL